MKLLQLFARSLPLVLLLGFTNCAHKITRIGYNLNPVPTSDTCQIQVVKFENQSTTTKKIGTIYLGESGFSTRCNQATALAILKLEACNIGADIVNIIEEKKPDILSSCYRCKAELLMTVREEQIVESDSSDYVVFKPHEPPQQAPHQISRYKDDCQIAVALGILYGGGSLVGLDIEYKIAKQLGVQVGVGLVGFGASINFHFNKNIRSSFIALQYFNQGIGESFLQSMAGPTFVFRGKKWFTFYTGLAKTINKGPAWPYNTVQPNLLLTYGIGVYFPF
jgi:hypothetical protein